jgi:hypothetical protein
VAAEAFQANEEEISELLEIKIVFFWNEFYLRILIKNLLIYLTKRFFNNELDYKSKLFVTNSLNIGKRTLVPYFHTIRSILLYLYRS